MSALSTPGGGGTTAQSKPTSGKQKYQKLDINSLYCANRNENSEPSSVKSQLSRKHGMQSLGKVPSARRPPANLPSLKTETGQDPNTNSISATSTTVATPASCTSQTTTTISSSSVLVGSNAGGWVPLPPPSSPHFRSEFPSLDAAAHRAADHTQPQLSLRPQTEGSWTSGGTAGARQEAPAAAPTSHTPAYPTILPPFLMKGSGGSGLGLGGLGAALESRPAPSGPSPSARGASRAPPSRASDVLTARPILRDEQINSLDDIARDAGWAQHDDIDYDQKLDFSDGESSSVPMKPMRNNNNSNRASIENERLDSKMQETGDEDQLWAERRQKQKGEIEQAVARARQRKEEEQRRQRESVSSQKDLRDKDRNEQIDRDRGDNRDRDRDSDLRERDRADMRDRDRLDNRDRDRLDREKDRMDSREKERGDLRDRDVRDKERDRERDRDRFDNRDRDLRDRDRDRMDNRSRDSRDRLETDKDMRDRDRNDNRDRDRDRDRFDRDRMDRDRMDRDRERDRDRDRDFRERDRDYGRDREREHNNAAYSSYPKNQGNIPPRFLKQQQRQQEDHKGWAFTGKPAPRRQEPPAYNNPPQRQPPHNGRRSYPRDASDREDEFRREKDPSGPQWRSEMQDFDRPRELDRSNSKDSYKDYDYKGRRSDEKKMSEAEHNRTAADKLSEVFERKSVGLIEPFAVPEPPPQASVPERKMSPPAVQPQLEPLERDFGKASWADVAQEENNYNASKASAEKALPPKESKESERKEIIPEKVKDDSKNIVPAAAQPSVSPLHMTLPPNLPATVPALQPQKYQNNNHAPIQNNINNQQLSHSNIQANLQRQTSPTNQSSSDTQTTSIKTNNQTLPNTNIPNELSNVSQTKLLLEATVEPNIKPVVHIPVKEFSEESLPSKSNTDSLKVSEPPIESLQSGAEMSKREDKRNERISNEHLNKVINKEPIERKSSGSGSEKKGRGYGGGGSGGGAGYAVVYNNNRSWGGGRDARGRRPPRSSHRASDSDASGEGGAERRERRRAHRPPVPTPADPAAPLADSHREPFAPRGQPSRRGRGGGFQGPARPPAPAKRVAGYGPPNTKSPFSQANRAVKDGEDIKDNPLIDDKSKGYKGRAGCFNGRGRDRRARGPHSGEDENWETTSEHSDGGTGGGRRRQKQPGGRNHPSGNRQAGGRNAQGAKKDPGADGKPGDISEGMTDLKISSNKEDEVVDDGFQEVRNKKNSKDARGSSKEENQHINKHPRSHSNQGGGRNQSSSRNASDKPNSRGSAPAPGKSGAQYERPRQGTLPPRFAKQRQKQQLGLTSAFGPDTGAAPPPPAVNAWDKPIAQTLRGVIDEPVEPVEPKQMPLPAASRPPPTELPAEPKPALVPAAPGPDKTGVLDGSTPPVETIIFENTNYKTVPPADALKQKYQPSATTAKPQTEEPPPEMEARPMAFNGDVRTRPRSIQELIGDNGRPVTDGENTLGLQMSFDAAQKAEDSSDMKLDFAFDSDLGQLTEDKSAKALGLPRGVHMSASNTISPLAADLNLKIASVKKVWEMPAVAEGSEELQFAGFEENNAETGAPPNVCKVKPTQQLQSPPPQHYNVNVNYQGGYGGLSVPSPPAMLFNSSQPLLASSQQLPQQGGIYGFLDQSRGQFGGFPGTHYGAGSGPYNYQAPPDMFQGLQSQYRMAPAAGAGAAFGQSGQLGNNPSTVLISSTSNSLMSAAVKPSSQQIGAIDNRLYAGSKGGAVGGVGGVGGVNTYQQQYVGYSTPVGDATYSLPGLLPRPAPPGNSYYSYQAPAAPAPSYPLQYSQPAQNQFQSQYLSNQLQVMQQMQQQQYRGPIQQFGPPRTAQPQLKSPLHEHANGLSALHDAGSPTPKPTKHKPPHSPPHHKYHQQQHHQGQLGVRGGGRNSVPAPRYPAPIQRPVAPAYRSPASSRPHRPPLYHHQPRHGGNSVERVAEVGEVPTQAEVDDPVPTAAPDAPPPPAEVKAD